MELGSIPVKVVLMVRIQDQALDSKELIIFMGKIE